MIDQSSLFFRVFKAKYFPHGSVLDASASSGSYAWKSILKARSVVSDGLLWRGGDGLSIRVYKDNWIPGAFLTKAVSPCAGFLEDLRVAELINPDTGWWDTQKIELPAHGNNGAGPSSNAVSLPERGLTLFTAHYTSRNQSACMV